MHDYIPYDGRLDVEEYIDEGIVSLAGAGPKQEQGERFDATFKLLSHAFGSNALKRFDGQRHVGRMGLVAFECIAVGIGKNIASIQRLGDPASFVHDRIAKFWKEAEIARFLSPGLRGTIRIQRTVPFWETWFRP